MGTNLVIDSLRNKIRFMEIEMKGMQQKIRELESENLRLKTLQRDFLLYSDYKNVLKHIFSSSPFSSLPKEVKDEILSKCKTNDLLQWRAVSSEMKSISECLLKYRRETLVFIRSGGKQNEREEMRNKIITLLKIFTYAKKVVLQSPKKYEVCMEFDELLKLCSKYLKRVKELKVDDSNCRNENCLLIADNFPCIERIELQWSLNEDKLSRLLHSLKYLKSVYISQISGICFQNITNQIEVIEMYIDNVIRLSEFPRIDSLIKCRIWHYAHIDVNDSQLVIETVVNKMPNLKQLHLNSLRIQHFDTFYFEYLEKLTLEYSTIYSIMPANKMNTVTSLSLSVDISSENMAILLSRFPNVQHLNVNSSYLRGMALDVVNVLRELRSLKTLNLTFEVRTLQELVIDVPPVDGEPVNIIIELLKAVCGVSQVSVDIYYRNRAALTIIEECKQFVANTYKKSQEISLEFMRKP